MAGRMLSKTRYVAGLQCLRRLWRMVNEPQDYSDPPPGSPLAMGTEIGREAHRLFPRGVLVTEEPWQHAQAVQTTRRLMEDPTVPAIFEAAFQHEDIRIRVDVLERLGGGAWGLREVKGSTRVKDYFLHDLAIQAYVLAGAGVPVASVELLHVNSRYVRGADGICWPEFFTRADVAEQVRERQRDIPARLLEMRAALALDAAPAVEPGPHCEVALHLRVPCRLHRDEPADWIALLPRLHPRQAASLATLGIESISAIPSDFP